MKTISFAFDKVDREFLVSLLAYYDLKQKEKALEEKISSFFSSNEKDYEDEDEYDEDSEIVSFSELCKFIIRKDFSYSIFDKIGKLFTEVTTDKLTDHIFSTMELNLGMNLPRYEIFDNLVRLKSIVERSYTEELPDPKFVEEFIHEIDKILAYFGLDE
jgi:hypothetical protein